MSNAAATLPILTESNLEDVYSWIGALPLSKPVRNIAKDLSDGVLIAEIISHYLPRYVALHNFTHVNSVSLKRYNWETLEKMVFKYLNIHLSDEQVRMLVNGNVGTMESFLLFLKDKIDLAVAERRFRPTKRRSRSTASTRGSVSSLNQSDSEYERDPSTSRLGKEVAALKIASTPKSQIDHSGGQSKDEQLQKLYAQVQYLERIIDQKDEHIAALTKKLEKLNIQNSISHGNEQSAAQKSFQDEHNQILLSQIHYLESVIQQKEEGINALSKQNDRLMELVYPGGQNGEGTTASPISPDDSQSPLSGHAICSPVSQVRFNGKY
uniref:Calponin-homology (CH) domain-containing protein n=1 Tax=Panagrellus redivivus TaxID=6233 RepID=A0A7E4VVR6_PANRE